FYGNHQTDALIYHVLPGEEKAQLIYRAEGRRAKVNYFDKERQAYMVGRGSHGFSGIESDIAYVDPFQSGGNPYRWVTEVGGRLWPSGLNFDRETSLSVNNDSTGQGTGLYRIRKDSGVIEWGIPRFIDPDNGKS